MLRTEGANINRYINWPLDNSSIAPLTIFVHEIHKRGGRLKLYYTTRELSTRVDILWPLRSLGREIIDDWTTLKRTQPGVDGPGGMSWLQEHLRTGYEPCWDTYLGNGTFDVSAAAPFASSSWQHQKALLRRRRSATKTRAPLRGESRCRRSIAGSM